MKVRMLRGRDGYTVTTHTDDSRDKRALCTVTCPAVSAVEVKAWIQRELPAILAESAQVYVESVGTHRYIGNGGE